METPASEDIALNSRQQVNDQPTVVALDEQTHLLGKASGSTASIGRLQGLWGQVYREVVSLIV